MKHSKTILILSICAMGFANQVMAQRSSNEGIQRQVLALKNAMSAFRSSVETRIDPLEARENMRTTCLNDQSIHWPTHPNADGQGCVSHEDMVVTSEDNNVPTDGCFSQPVRWTGRFGATCSATAWGSEEGEAQSVAQTRANRCDEGFEGTAVATCQNGSFVMSEMECVQRLNPCK
jgi:hypothetical protein